ncbi:MAG TPA: hypothetical protein ENK75_01225 [Saprospiraceae bacterium]|nr:hypothetical protein [Saprospiraceae bacterium]
MKKIVCLIIFQILIIQGYAQDHFPESWIGNYKGTLAIYTIDSVAVRVPMALKIQPTAKDSIYNWTIIYTFKNGEKDVRSYQLLVVDNKKGMYKIDEKNSIVIDTFYLNDVVTSFFNVMDNFIIATYKKNKDADIIFEIIAAKSKEISSTGGQKTDNDSIPEVLSYSVNGRQKAILYKIPEN